MRQSINKGEFVKFLREKINISLSEIKRDIEELDKSKTAETKSSAGDKFETSREMIQQERNKLEERTKQLEMKLHLLTSIDTAKNLNKIDLGSIVVTDQSIYFLGIAEGVVVFDQLEIKAISFASPIGMRLKASKEGEKIEFNKRQETVLSIY